MTVTLRSAFTRKTTALVAGLLMSACLGSKSFGLKSHGLSPASLDGQWFLETPAPAAGAPGPATAAFLPEQNSIQGHDGCNAYQAHYEERAPKRLKFGGVMSTKALCSWQPSGSDFPGVFAVVTHYRIDPGPVLVLLDEQDRVVARMRPIEPDP